MTVAKKFILGIKDLPRAILLAVILAWVLIPFYFLLAVAFSPEGTQIYGITILKKFTLENFKGIFSGYNAIWHPLFNSAVITVSTTFLALLIAVPAAYALSHLRHLKSGRGLYLSFFVLRGIPSISLVLPFYLIFSKLHLLNTLHGLIIALTPLALPYCVWILRVTFDSIPREIEEAASVDGAGPLQTFGKVVLPIAASGIAAAGILSALFTLQDSSKIS
jgi:ABC-type glycerol-3-phosphate transport system permease component